MSVAWVAAHLRMVVCIRDSGSSSNCGGCGDDVDDGGGDGGRSRTSKSSSDSWRSGVVVVVEVKGRRGEMY